MCVGFRPLSILFILYIVFALVYIIATTNGFDFVMVVPLYSHHFQHQLAYLFPPVVAYRALMYTEFRGTSFDIHIWDHRGAEMTLTGESILRYVRRRRVLSPRMESIPPSRWECTSSC